MSRAWFSTELESVATFWRILRRDGIALGFVTHDRDLWFDGVLHRAAPGMVPSAVRRSAGFEPDSAELAGVLTHDALSAADIACGRFDGAGLRFGLVDWQSGETAVLYAGTIGSITEADGRFQAAVASCKAELLRDLIPRTSPACRAEFCGPECGLSATRFDRRARLARCEPDSGAVQVEGLPNGAGEAARYAGGRLRWLDGPLAGTATPIVAAIGSTLMLGHPLDRPVPDGTLVWLREGCDRTIATCSGRFGNARNFRGEPALPGNDFVARTPAA